MSEYQSNITPQDLVDRLVNLPGPVSVVTHGKPDGDAIGSVIAMTACLNQIGVKARGLLVAPVPEALAKLPGSEWYDVIEPNAPADDLPAPRSMVIVDTGAWSQVGPTRSMIEPRLEHTIIIDHHLMGDIPAGTRYVDADAGSCCEIMAELIDRLMPYDAQGPIGKVNIRRNSDRGAVHPLPPVIRDALFVGIASDTGWFRFSNARPQTHEVAAKLLRQGVDHAQLYARLEQSERPNKVALMTRALDSLQLFADGQAAVMSLSRSDFEQTGATDDETDRLIDLPQQIGTVQVIALLSERPDSDDGLLTSISFRSKPGDEAVNVADLASMFGGGGHARAAGAKVHKPIGQVIDDVIAAISKTLA